MKLLKKVDRREIKECFLITPNMRKYGIASVRATKPPSREQYVAALEKSKQAVKKLSESKIDAAIGGEYKKRLNAYNSAEWFIGSVSIKEIGVWKGAGGLPIAWTVSSLEETAKKVKKALEEQSTKIRKRAKRAIPTIIEFKDIILKEKYLFPIIFEAGIGTNGRKGLQKMKGDIDDGSMRCIALAIAGNKTLKAYIGMKK